MKDDELEIMGKKKTYILETMGLCKAQKVTCRQWNNGLSSQWDRGQCNNATRSVMDYHNRETMGLCKERKGRSVNTSG